VSSMKVRFRTGEMADLYGISKQTLIYYNKIGLFEPGEADPDTGYRRYYLEQCEVLDAILALKHVGMPLKDIKQYLAMKTTEERIVQLEKQESEIAKKLAVIERSRKRIRSMIGSFRERMQLVPFEMGVRRMEERGLRSIQIEPPYDYYQLELGIKKAYRAVLDDSGSGLHEMLAVVDMAPDGTKLFRAIGMYVEGGGNDTIKAGNYAYIIHQGRYDMIDASYEKLLAYVAEMNLQAQGSVLENILLDVMAVSSEDEYLVEIMVEVCSK